uniref:Uncharacterized protein n=1 Tax=Moniliophthora roreri TaxID=221103 RepID=A0A0W0FJ01_MONRR
MAFLYDLDGSISSRTEKLKLHDKRCNPAVEKTLDLQREWVRGSVSSFLNIAAFDLFMPGFLATPEPGKQYMAVILQLWHPLSRGQRQILTSTSSILVDMGILVEAFKLVRRVVSSDTMGSHIEVSSGQEYQTDEELENFIHKTVGTTYHHLKGMRDDSTRCFAESNFYNPAIPNGFLSHLTVNPNNQ